MIGLKPNVLIQMGDKPSLYKNNVVQSGLDWILDLIANQTTDKISHIAVGDNSTQVSLGDIKLYNELVRKGVTTVDRDLESAIAEVFFDTPEANFHWYEIGLFANGTDAKDSGKLIARAVIDENKDTLRTATISWDMGIQNI